LTAEELQIIKKIVNRWNCHFIEACWYCPCYARCSVTNYDDPIGTARELLEAAEDIVEQQLLGDSNETDT